MAGWDTIMPFFQKYKYGYANSLFWEIRHEKTGKT